MRRYLAVADGAVLLKVDVRDLRVTGVVLPCHDKPFLCCCKPRETHQDERVTD
jgi:hypothetical protein